ncbi:hypothetical protein SAMN04487914_106120 [Arthrobacter sp. ok909]|nr:hypothetical protein SAMN04487914_106120 [Arthrobacter sp. ok909]
MSSALNATFVPKRKANTAYLAGNPALNPSGDTVTAKANFTSGASYDAANWNVPTAYAPASVALKVAPSPGRKIAFAGDSITTGTGASVSNRRFSVVAPMLARTRWYSRNPLQAGVAGNT